MRRRYLTFLLLLAMPALAQQPPVSLTLDGAEKLALQNNPQISAARLFAEAAYEVPKEFRANTQPQVAGNLTAAAADSGSRLAAGALNSPVLYSRTAAGVGLNQVLTDFGRTSDLVSSAKLRAHALDQVTETSRADVLLATTRAYFAVLRSNAVLRVAQQTVDSRQVLADQVTALFNNQLKSQLDVSFANVNLADARLLLSQARNDEQSAETVLAAVIGLPEQTVFSLSDEAMPGPLPTTMDPFVQQALQDRPELKDLRLEEEAAQKFADSERALSRPVISVAAAAGGVPAGVIQVPNRYGGVGLNVNVPIWNGGLFHARQTEAELRTKAAAERVKDLALRISRDVRVAYLDVRTAFERVGLTAQLQSQAQLALDLAQGRYNLGLSSIVELSQAQLNLTAAQIANAAARYDYQAQRAFLDYQSGALR